MDEATSALDAESERRVQNEFNSLHKEKGMTAIVIAHRLSTIRKADNILVLGDGMKKEEGTDKELRDLNGIYANLCRIQEGNLSNEDIAHIADSIGMKKASIKSMKSIHENKDNQEEKNVVKKSAEELKAEEEEAQKLKSRYTSLLWAEAMKYKFQFIIAVTLAIISGYNMPVSGMLYGMIMMDLNKVDDDEMRDAVNLDFIGFIICGVVMLVMSIFMIWMFGFVAAKVTYSLRSKLYSHIMQMEAAWIERPENGSSTLNNILAEGTENVNGVIRGITFIMAQSISGIVIGAAIAFFFSWVMALIVCVCAPVIAFAGWMRTRFHVGFAKEFDTLYEKSTAVLADAVKNFRLVASFSSEARIMKMYGDSLQAPIVALEKKAWIIGLLFGIGQCIPNLVYAGLFFFNALLSKEYDLNPKNSFIAMFSLLFAAMQVGQLQTYAPDLGKASASIVQIFGIHWEKDVNMTIKQGQKVAIVGISGSGKSTIINLIERFYDIESGKITIDGVDIREFDLHHLRKSIGYVPQEPVLFDATIEDNIKYGRDKITGIEGTEDVTEDEIREACRVSHALNFIEGDEKINDNKDIILKGLDEKKENEVEDMGTGFKRRVGAKGMLLSGGQKQRIAIARAILKKPNIVLFDEATSALDSQNEKIVQQALNSVSQGRTSIVVAHNLGTISGDDMVYVLENGIMVEHGLKCELEKKDGHFKKLMGKK